MTDFMHNTKMCGHALDISLKTQ